ncbi:ras and ef-hand domain-containing protein [Anaeramoeba ignava]|uniref:Ras and ef-hand domain-containing protein n=1 Tax=Anaeramoeba ignava TaxID=1746090 RepID=A0A9Q0RC67_ANAIG|nr:ras and ef-hand domain-containing protein [Anaeramoeba ignava]
MADDIGYDSIFKIALIGDASVGKTNLIRKYVDNEFKDESMTTVGFDMKNKILEVDGSRVNLQIWDTAGQERFNSNPQVIFRNSSGVLIVFDVCDKQSFEKIEFWLNLIKENAGENAQIGVIGNKIDLEDHEVTQEEIEESSKKLQVRHFLTSAKTGEGVEKAFYDFTSLLISQNNQEVEISIEENNNQQTISIEKKPEIKAKNGGCC